MKKYQKSSNGKGRKEFKEDNDTEKIKVDEEDSDGKAREDSDDGRLEEHSDSEKIIEDKEDSDVTEEFREDEYTWKFQKENKIMMTKIQIDEINLTKIYFINMAMMKKITIKRNLKKIIMAW